MEISTKETPPENEQEESSPSLGNHNTQEATPVTLGHVSVSERSTSLDDWCDCDRQSLLSELQNRRRNK